MICQKFEKGGDDTIFMAMMASGLCFREIVCIRQLDNRCASVPVSKTMHALARTPSPQLPCAVWAVGKLLLALRCHSMAEVLPNDIRINIFSTDYLIYYGLVTLLVEEPNDR